MLLANCISSVKYGGSVIKALAELLKVFDNLIGVRNSRPFQK